MNSHAALCKFMKHIHIYNIQHDMRTICTSVNHVCARSCVCVCVCVCGVFANIHVWSLDQNLTRQTDTQMHTRIKPWYISQPDLACHALAGRLANTAHSRTNIDIHTCTHTPHIRTHIHIRYCTCHVRTSTHAHTHSKTHVYIQVTSPVMWEKTINSMMERGYTDGYELGPGKVVAGIVKRVNKAASIVNIEA
jgi:hypothetical protein